MSEAVAGKAVRVGILTHHWVANFGANLQALASQLAFGKHGAEVVILDYKEPGWESRIRGKAGEAQMAMHDAFLARHLKLSPPLPDEAALRNYAEANCDIIAVGSDAMFEVESPLDPLLLLRALRRRKLPAKGRLPAFWLNWPKTEGSPARASLSVSAMGTNYPFIRGRLRSDMRAALGRYDFLGVRDDWTGKMIRSVSGRKDHQHFPDPVFSLVDNLGEARKQPAQDLSECVLVSGAISENTITGLREEVHKRGLKLVGIRIPERPFEYASTDFNINEPLGPLEWFALLGNAAGYVGIRFHALVSCMVQGTPVINVDPHFRSRVMRQSSKMYDLCKRAGTPERFFTPNILDRTPSGKLLDLLFDEKLRLAANAYCERASVAFDTEVRVILSLAAGSKEKGTDR